jgi:FtsP/CotA-like multicopper oxidase with cupredoxin domain
MTHSTLYRTLSLVALVLLLGAVPLAAQVLPQCPTQPGGIVLGDSNGDGMIRAADGEITNPMFPNQVCMHIASGDGFIGMADFVPVEYEGQTVVRRRPQYIFGFNNVTGTPVDEVLTAGTLAAGLPAPTIALNEGDHFFLSLTNVGLMMRPDLFDPHSVHWHGIPNIPSIFDGVPESGLTINQGYTFTFFYKISEPGTYMYHCHVEALEHMQMGMLGNIFVRSAQDRLQAGTNLNGFLHQTGIRYAYDDGDGSTRYDVEVPLQIHSLDSYFHDQHLAVQPLPFYTIKDDYALFNGRGYPDTVITSDLPGPNENGSKPVQKVHSRVTATKGQRILLRVSNLNITRNYTIGTTGLPLKVVGFDAKLLRGPSGKNLYYDTNSVFLSSGRTVDIIVDTANVPTGTYFLYTTNLNYLSNGTEDFGGLMTEIQVQ